MLILTTPGTTLTTDGRIIAGGPQNILLPPGWSMDSGGRLCDGTPRWDVKPQQVEPLSSFSTRRVSR